MPVGRDVGRHRSCSPLPSGPLAPGMLAFGCNPPSSILTARPASIELSTVKLQGSAGVAGSEAQ